MNQTLAWFIGIVAIIGIGFGISAFTNSSEDAMMEKDGDVMVKEEGESMMEKDSVQDDSMMKEEDAMMKKEGETMMKDEGAMTPKDSELPTGQVPKGSYEAYAPEKLALASTGDVVLFFRASWCPTCRALDADIKAHLDTIPAGVTILDVNYDTATALKQKYGVTYQHTLVQVDAQGNQIVKWMGSPSLASLLTNIK